MIKRIIGSLIAGMVGLALFTVQIGAVILYAQYPRAAIDLQEPYADNSYHNPKDVARVGDMLYVHYRKPKKLTVVNGVLEISSWRTRLIKRNTEWHHSPVLWEEDGSLLLFGSGQGVYDPAGRKWSEEHPLLGIEDMTDNFRVWGDLVVYQSRADANSSGALCGYHLQTGEKTVFLEGIRICYIAEVGIVYYLAEYREDGEDRRAVRAYHIADGTDDHIGDIPASCGWIGTRFYMDGDLLLFGATGVYAFRVDQKNVEPIAITVSNSAIILNVYGGYAYIRHGDGLYKHCLDTKEETKLVEGEVARVYLFDETWVYYRGYGTADLWRVSQDGTVIEKLYQKGK